MQCNLCNKEIDIVHDDDIIRSYKYADNIFVCPDCIDYYLNHRIVYKYKCKSCGIEFDMSARMLLFRDGSTLLNNECSKCYMRTAVKQSKNKKKQSLTDIEYKQYVENINNKRKLTNKIRFGTEIPQTLKSVQLKRKTTSLKYYGAEHPLQNKEILEKTQQTNLKRYGHVNPAHGTNEDIVKQTCLKRYGVEHTLQAVSIRNKIKETNLKRYGVECVLSSAEIQNKSKETCLKRYNTEYYLSSKEAKLKTKNTCNIKYGVDNPTQYNKINEKIKQTLLKRYGHVNPAHGTNEDKVKQTLLKRYGHVNPAHGTNEDKVKQTMLKRYGVEYSMQYDKIRNKSKQTMLKRYGVENNMYIPEIRSKVARSARVSKLEKRVIEMLSNRGIEFQHQYTIRQNEVTHSFDFAIFKDSVLIALVDADGVYYHGYTIDGTHNTEEYDSRRTLCIPEGVKFIVIFENHIEQGFRELMYALNKDYDQYILDIFTWCRSQEFPWPNYTDKELKISYSNLCTFNNFKPNGKTGERIVRHFHRSVYKSHRNNKLSPWRAYQDDELLMRVIKNRFIYVNNLEPARILEGFNISKIAQKVSVFRPSLAKILINKYLSKFETIFDPFSGFSGRMLGCCSSGKQYIGQDLSGEAVTESNEIIKFLGLNASVVQKDVLGSSGEYPCLFTCSPYTDKEIWGKESEFKTCDEWIDICLQQFKCKKYLFVVDQTTKFKEFVVETIQNKSHFGKNFEQVIIINKR